MAREKITYKIFLLAAVFVGALIFPFSKAEAAASFVVAPTTSVVPAGTQFTVNISINSTQAVNAAQGTIIFPTDRLQVVQISKSSSIFQFWSQEPSFSNSNGTISFSGGLPSPGFVGSNGLILRVTFRASGSGVASVNITQGAILANDGLGTNVLNNIIQGAYTIGPAPASTPPKEIANQINSKAYPNSNLWYSQPTADFYWTINPDVDRIAYELTQSVDSKPSQGYEPTDHVQYSLGDRADGVWYFNLQLRSRGAWGQVLAKKIKIDRTSPVAPEVKNITKDPTDPQPVFTWSAKDETSGIKTYRVKVGSGEWLTPTPQDSGKITLPVQAPGKHSLTVEAEDFAGNKSSATTDFAIESIDPPKILEYPRNISSIESSEMMNQVIAIKGTAPGASTVKVYLRNKDNSFAFTSSVASDGSWSVAYSGSLSSGSWILTAQAEDSRGAVSVETDPVSIAVNDKTGNLIRFFASWGAVGLVATFAVILIVFAILMAWARFKHYRLKLKKEIMAAQIELIKDFERIEKDLGGRAGNMRNKVSGDMDVLAKDIGKELDRLKKDVD